MKKYIVFIISLFFVINVKAFDKTITIAPQEKVGLSLNDSGEVINQTGEDTHLYPYFHVKNSSKGTVVCLSGIRDVNAPGENTSCTLETSTNHGVAYIINLIYGTAKTDNEKYYWTEVLVNGYLGTLEQLKETNSYFYLNIISKNDKKIMGTGYSFNEILQNAKKYENSVVKDPTITVDNKESVNLVFTKNNDGYYYSNAVTINSNVTYDFGTLSNGKFSYTKNGNSYVFKIKESDIKLGTTESFTKSISITSSYMTSSRYNCGADVQKVALTNVEEYNPTDSITITGSVRRESINLQISKINENNNSLPGAQFMFQTEEQKKNNVDGVILTSNVQDNMVIENLIEGTYYLTEINSPDGYVKLKDSVKIVISSEGTVTVDGKENSTGIIKIKNNLIETEISKVSAVNGEELPGATLEILNEKNEKISCTIINDGKKEVLETCSWISGEKPVKVIGLKAGKYYLSETISPDGYELNTEKVLFEVKNDGSLTKVVMENQLEVEVPNTLSSRSALLLAIAMFDIALGIGIITYVKKNKIKE